MLPTAVKVWAFGSNTSDAFKGVLVPAASVAPPAISTVPPLSSVIVAEILGTVIEAPTAVKICDDGL